jgi:hypothetical protein
MPVTICKTTINKDNSLQSVKLCTEKDTIKTKGCDISQPFFYEARFKHDSNKFLIFIGAVLALSTLIALTLMSLLYG